MKTYKEVYKDSLKVNAKIKDLEAKIEQLQMLDERRAAAAAGDHEKHKELIQAFKASEDEIKKLCDVLYIEKVKRAYLQDNEKVALYNDCKEAIKEVLTKYNGKPYGEKTREKIREELKEKTGCYIWFGNREINISYHGTNPNGYNIRLCEIRVTTNYDTPVITENNKIDAAALEKLYHYEKYTENPTKAAKDLIKRHNKLYEELKKVDGLLSEYNLAAPDAVKHAYITNPLYRTINGI